MAAESKSPWWWRWLGMGFTSLLAAVGGGVLIYASPLVEQVIKPAKPVANFAHHAQGLTLTLQNRSTGAAEGWWDFGDGSALEPFVPQQESVQHDYPRPGTYTVKLLLRNLLGDESERSATVTLEPAETTPPAIEHYQIIPLSPDGNSPATFRVVARVKAADVCIWGFGDSRPLEVSSDTTGTLDRLVTLQEPGWFTFRLVAVAGKKTAEKSEVVFVGMGNPSPAEAALQVTYEAARVERENQMVHVPVAFPAQSEAASHPFQVERSVAPGYRIVDAKLLRAGGNVQDPRVEVAADRTRFVVKGQLTRGKNLLGKRSPPPTWAAPVQLTLEKQGKAVTKTSDPILVQLQVPGQTVVPLPVLPAGWEVKNRKMTLELRDGTQVVYKDSKLPLGTVVRLKSKSVVVSGQEADGQVRLQIAETNTALRPVGN